MLFEQVLDEDLGCASYLVGDDLAGGAVVVDPPLDLEPVRALAERRGVRITRVLETHTHADHVSGHGRLALEDGVPVSIHQEADAEYPHDVLADGDTIDVGDVRIAVIHTPGHRPEHCAFAVSDRTRADDPWLVLTGDSLFVGDLARPDLAVEAREGAEALFGSLHRLVELGDGVEVYPGHVAGSLCGAGMSAKASTTIGFERRFNPMLRHEAIDDFVEASTGSAGVRPPNVERIVALNRGPFVTAPEPPPRMDDAGDAAVLDVRPADAYLQGHRPGAVNVPVGGSAFGTKAGFALEPDRDIVVAAADEEEALRAARRLNAVGFLRVAGWLPADASGERTDPVGADELERIAAEDPARIIDVREAHERVQEYIPGTRHVPFHLVRAYAEHLGGNGTLVTLCESGPRAAVAASVLSAHGVPARPVLDGGLGRWKERGGETVSFRRCGG